MLASWTLGSRASRSPLATGERTVNWYPEQATPEPEKIGAATDVFSLGATLYHALTGKAPYRGPSWEAVLPLARRCEFDRAPLETSDVPARLR